MIQLTIQGRLRVSRIAASSMPTDGRPLSDAELRRLVLRGRADEFETSNLVVDLGLSAISRMIGFGLGAPNVTNGTDTVGVSDYTDLQITEMRLGNLNNPTAPTAADNDMEDPILLTTITPTVTYPGNAQVRWSGTLPANAFTGDQVTEEGLFLENGALFARTTFAPQAIVSGSGLQFDHTFTLARA